MAVGLGTDVLVGGLSVGFSGFLVGFLVGSSVGAETNLVAVGGTGVLVFVAVEIVGLAVLVGVPVSVAVGVAVGVGEPVIIAVGVVSGLLGGTPSKPTAIASDIKSSSRGWMLKSKSLL